MKLMGATDDEEINNDTQFAKVAVGVFMVLMAVLRMPMVLGVKFSPFEAVGDLLLMPWKKGKRKVDAKPKKNKKKTQ